MPLQRNRPSHHGNLGKGDLGKPDKAFINDLGGKNDWGAKTDSWKY